MTIIIIIVVNNKNNDDNDKNTCTVIERSDLEPGKVIIVINVYYRSYQCAYYINNDRSVPIPYTPKDVEGWYKFTFTANLDSIAEDYNRIKDTIKEEVFNDSTVQKQYENARLQGCDNITKDLIIPYYPKNLNVYKNDEYLIVTGTYNTNIEVYSYDYPYIYFNKSLATLHSKHFHPVKYITNELYKGIIRFEKDYETEEGCKYNKKFRTLEIKNLGKLYTNKYINFVLILNNIYTNGGVESNEYIESIGDCSLKIHIDYSAPGVNYLCCKLGILLSRNKYCKGVYTLADFKDSKDTFCTAVYKNQNSLIYTIDLNQPYEKPSFTNGDGEKYSVFDSGSQVFSERSIPENKSKMIQCTYLSNDNK